HLFARDFSVEIDEADLYVGGKRGQQLICFSKRAVGIGHINPPLQIHHGTTRARRRLVDVDTGAWRAGRIVGRAQQARVAREVVVDVPLVPDVIAGCHHIDTVTEKFLRNGGCNAEAGGGIFAVRDYKVDRFGPADVLDVVGDDAAPGMTEDVADKEKFHRDVTAPSAAEPTNLTYLAKTPVL